MQVVLYVVLAILAAIGIWQLTVWMIEIQDKNRKYQAAENYARERARLLLVVPGPWGIKPARRWFNKPAHGGGDVCLDIDARAVYGHPCAVVGSVTRVPFPDNTFGAAFVSHLLEHMATTEDAVQALDELNRVAEAVFIVYPYRQSIAAWVIPEHHLWVWQKGDKMYLKQRGMSGNEEVYHCKG
ncbi:MAG TPA: class I SAM-dependent methyltransferase [Dehalococcoidia bacterium]|nr:class I SAM-dependent methyltransferase [Dehalococcoidia bacterium]